MTFRRILMILAAVVPLVCPIDVSVILPTPHGPREGKAHYRNDGAAGYRCGSVGFEFKQEVKPCLASEMGGEEEKHSLPGGNDEQSRGL